MKKLILIMSVLLTMLISCSEEPDAPIQDALPTQSALADLEGIYTQEHYIIESSVVYTDSMLLETVLDSTVIYTFINTTKPYLIENINNTDILGFISWLIIRPDSIINHFESQNANIYTYNSELNILNTDIQFYEKKMYDIGDVVDYTTYSVEGIDVVIFKYWQEEFAATHPLYVGSYCVCLNIMKGKW